MTTKLKILQVIPSYYPAVRYGGPITAVHQLARSLVSLGHEVHVFTTNVDGPKTCDVPINECVKFENVNVWYFELAVIKRLYYSIGMMKALSQSVTDFDLVHIHSIFLWPTFAAAKMAKQKKIPYIVSPRGSLVAELVKRKNPVIKLLWIYLIEKRNLERASAIHFTSELERQEALKFKFALPETFVVPNGFDFKMPSLGETALPSDIKPIVEQKRYLLYLGRVNWKKGLDRMIEALRYIPDIPLVIAGNDEGNYRPILEEIASKNGVLERVLFAGYVGGNSKLELIKSATLLVLPSYSENFGNVVLEAMALACPVVVTPEVGLADTVSRFKTGIVADGNPQKFGEAVKQILADPKLLAEMGKNGERVAHTEFSWNVVAKRMEEQYEKVIAQHRTICYQS